jgi:hypothetical protein
MSAERSEQFKVRESHSRSRFTENDMTVISQIAELLHRHSAPRRTQPLNFGLANARMNVKH